MIFKFAVGQAVEYKPANGRIRLCTVVKQMLLGDGHEFKYRIRNEQEAFERNVFEYELTAAETRTDLYGFVARLHHRKYQ